MRKNIALPLGYFRHLFSSVHVFVYHTGVCSLQNHRIFGIGIAHTASKNQFQSLAEIKPNQLILMVAMICPPKMLCPTDLLMHDLVYQVYNVVLATAVVPGVYQA